MNLKLSALSALVLACVACGTNENSTDSLPSSTTEAAATTTVSFLSAPLDEEAVDGYQSQIQTALQACSYVVFNPDYSTACSLGVEKSIELFEEFDKRTPLTLPKTRSATIAAISELEFWRDNCRAEVIKAADRKDCVLKTPKPGIGYDVVFPWYEETGRQN